MAWRTLLWLSWVALTIACHGQRLKSPEPLRMEPNETKAGVPVRVRILGERFFVAVDADFNRDRLAVSAGFRAELGGVALQDVLYVSANELAATVPAKLALGEHDLVLSDPKGRKGTALDAFRVVACVRPEDCTNNDLCDGLEVCKDGHCEPGPPQDCHDDDPCTEITCDPSAGCVVTAASYADQDQDGALRLSCGGDDCDDDPGACGAGCFPGNPVADSCDGSNQDCDEETDEDPEIIWYRDADADGHGDASQPVAACSPPMGTVAQATDCADQAGSDPQCNGQDGSLCHPGRVGQEVCDGADNDCDPGTLDGIDEPTLGAACDGSDADLCKEGTLICQGGGLICNDATDTTAEGPFGQPSCTDGEDNDCDTAADALDPDCAPPWTQQAGSGRTLQDLVAMDWIDADSGWLVGKAGFILATVDGGTTWEERPGPTSRNLQDTDFVDENRGWAVGAAGTILTTKDGGRTWTLQLSGIGNSINAVSFVDPLHGWAAGGGGRILATANGGNTWALQTTPTSEGILDIALVDAQTGWAVGNGGVILRTTNGGDTWDLQTSPVTTALRAVSFVDTNQGWVAGASGVVLVTADGGADWETQATPNTQNLYDVRFADASRGVAVGGHCGQPLVLYTDDGGEHWGAATLGASYFAWKAVGYGGDTWWIAADAGTVARATDPPAWTNSLVGNQDVFRDVDFVDLSFGWAVGERCGDSLFARTSNGGTAWGVEVDTLPRRLYAVDFVDATHGWVAGAGGFVYYTDNGGAGWQDRSTGFAGNLYGVAFADLDHGWVSGADGNLLLTTNGGQSWTPVSLTSTHHLRRVRTAGTQNAFVVGDNGSFERTVDGTTWMGGTQLLGFGSRFYDFASTGGQAGWIVGAGGRLLATPDAGTSWGLKESTTERDLRGVAAAGDSVWAVGDGGTIVYSSDQGASFTTLLSPTANHLRAVVFVDASHGWAVGQRGVILRFLMTP